MKISLSTLIAALLFWSQVHTQALELQYKSADGAITISGIDDKKPYSVTNGKKMFLSPQGIFELQGSLSEIMEVAYVPIIGSRSFAYKTGEQDLPLNEQFTQRYTSTFRISTDHTPSSNHLFITHSPMFSQICELWGEEKKLDKVLLLCAWVDPETSTHQISKQYYLDKETISKITDINTVLKFDKTSPKKLIPVLILFDESGTFIPLASSNSNLIWKDIAIDLIEDNANSLAAHLEKYQNVLEVDLMGSGTIHWASYFGSSNCLDLLFKKDPDLNLKTFARTTALHVAAAQGNDAVVEKLLTQGAKSSPKDKYGNTPLHYAAAFSQTKCAETLLNNKAKKSGKNLKGETPVFVAGKCDNANIIQLLEKHGAKFKFSKENRQILLIRAIKRNALDSVNYLLSKGSKADKPAYGVYPLIAAANAASGEIVKTLIDQGAAVNVKGKNDATPLMYACSNNHDAVVALIDAGADINARASDGTTALHVAILKHQIETTQFLLDHGADPNAKNEKGTPPFWIATQVGNRIGLNELISAGAICSMSPESAIPIMEYAFRHNIPEIVEITLSECIDTSFKFNEDIPSYWVANYYGGEEILNIYQKKGIDSDHIIKPKFASAKEVRNQIKLISRQDINYPRELQEIYGEFLAKIKIIIDYDGSVIFPKIVSNPVKELDRAILETINTWKFQPIVKNGEPVRTIVNLPWKVIPAPQQDNVYEIAQVDFKPRPIRQVAPRYPSMLKSSKTNGAVTVVFVVDKKGNVINPRAEVASHNEFIKPAIEAISKWKFSPAYVGGEKVNVRVRAPLSFRVN